MIIPGDHREGETEDREEGVWVRSVLRSLGVLLTPPPFGPSHRPAEGYGIFGFGMTLLSTAPSSTMSGSEWVLI